LLYYEQNEKSLYIKTVLALILVSLLFIDNLSSETAVVATSSSSSSSPAPNATQPMTANTTTTTDGLTNNNTTNAIGNAISEIVNDTLQNTTSALENATAALTNATKALQGVSSIPAAAPPSPPTPPPTTATITNASPVNSTTVINSIFENNLPAVFIIVISFIIGVPLVLDIILAYRRKSTAGTDKDDNRVVGMPDLYRSLMTFGIIVLVGTVIFYLLALITLNINDSTSPALQSLIDVLKSLGTILGTALATIIAFYFGTRAAESATEKAAAATTAAVTKAAAATTAEKEPPKVLNTIPADGATQVPVSSLISATFSEPMSSQTINENTFTIRRADDESTLIKGALSLSPDGKTAIFDPDQDFSPNTKYIAEIGTGAKDLAGNALASTKRWSFTTTTTS
jgi:Big-like domain-containing protein